MRIRAAAGLLACWLLAGCATMTVNLPPVTDAPTAQRLPGKVIWHDLVTSRPAEARAFYAGLFGWEFEDLGLDLGFGRTLNYTLIRHQGQLIGGMVDANRLDNVAVEDRDRMSQWVVLLSVADVDAAAAEVLAGGGQVLTPPTDFVDRGRLALIRDPQGAVVALLETRDGDPPDRPSTLDGFLWDELWADDVAAATGFYARLAPYTAGDRAVAEGGSYRYLEAGGEPRVGILPMPVPDLRPLWVTYVRVADPAAIAAKVPGLGGRVLLAPQPRELGGEVALIADPSGAGIAIQSWDPATRAANNED